MENINNLLKIQNNLLKNENENLKDEVKRLKIIVKQIFKIRTEKQFLKNEKGGNLHF